MSRIAVTRLASVALLGAMALIFSACDAFSSPQNTFNPAGEVARDQRNLFIATAVPAFFIMVFVLLGCVFLVLRFRKREGHDQLPKQIHGNNFLEISWTIAPALLLLAFVPSVVGGIVKLGDRPENAVQIEVNAFQYGWFFGYHLPDGTIVEGEPSSATDLGPGMVIPVDRNIDLALHSEGVIHSFWVPKLAGKTDVMPGHTNRMWIKADKIGEYQGQCAEFCGLQHSDMRFFVKVVTQAEYDAYVNGLAAARDGTAPDGELASTGSGE